MTRPSDRSDFQLQRAALVVERNWLYNLEALLSAAGRVLIRANAGEAVIAGACEAARNLRFLRKSIGMRITCERSGGRA